MIMLLHREQYEGVSYAILGKIMRNISVHGGENDSL